MMKVSDSSKTHEPARKTPSGELRDARRNPDDTPKGEEIHRVTPLDFVTSNGNLDLLTTLIIPRNTFCPSCEENVGCHCERWGAE